MGLPGLGTSKRTADPERPDKPKQLGQPAILAALTTATTHQQGATP